ncbi:MAG: bifunctional [glutamine synthetase] adenylyltransferase/[glutamine synthetase]-adenylyl-L-tyrosine phosphorylase [Holosporales bacterium]
MEARWPEVTPSPPTLGEQILARLEAEAATIPTDDAAATMLALRQHRQRLLLYLAHAEFTDTLPLLEQTAALSRFACIAVEKALEASLNEAQQAGRLQFALPPPYAPHAGLVVVGMGKLGAEELNFSSDIDLIVFYDDARLRAHLTKGEAQAMAVRLVRRMTEILSAHTADGYVFRTDLRLRPDPSSTPLAVSLAAAETYYSSIAATWERAAMIKARVIAGDPVAGAEFTRLIQPFVWRRSLDFAALDEIHAIKTQINPQRSFTPAAPGLNIKTGLGGIREVEFFVQTQQLIWGGRDKRLRGRSTLEALDALVETGRLFSVTASQLWEAYVFLRKTEHRIQLLHDEQTHRLPIVPEDLEQVAQSFSYPDTAHFRTVLDTHRRHVADAYSALFENTDAKPKADLTQFTAEVGDGMLQTLTSMGFRDPKVVAACLHRWHNRGYRVLMTPRAQQLLLEITPLVLEACAASDAPDAGVLAFDQFISRLSAGVQLFALLKSNPAVLSTLVAIMTSAPPLAEIVLAQPHLMDTLLMRQADAALPPPESLTDDLTATLAQRDGREEKLRALGLWQRDWLFSLMIRVFQQAPEAATIGTWLTALAEACVRAVLEIVRADFAAVHGHVPGSGFAVLGFGKLGSNALAIGSDLDLVFVYDAPDGASSDGGKPLAAPVYYNRLAQRVLSALTLPADRALQPLYEVDTRLRPDGEAGAVASSFKAFEAYYRTGSAQTWEFLALTCARPVAGDAGLCHKLQGIMPALLALPRDAQVLKSDAKTMHDRRAAAHPPKNVWDVKNIPGGMVTLEFIAQTRQLLGGKHYQSTAAALRAESDTASLATIYELYQQLQNLLRLTKGVNAQTAAILNEASIEAAEQTLAAHARTADDFFRGMFA